MMRTGLGTESPPGTPSFHPTDGPAAERLEAVQQENQALGRELLRCYEQLNLVFDITENIATLRDPDTIRPALLRRFGEMLSVGALLIDQDGTCVTADPGDSAGQRLQLDPARVHASLAREIELVRQTLHARVPSSDPLMRTALAEAHVLLGALRQPEGPAAVIIALRHGGEVPFDSGDILATESVLGYGGHILANAVMVRHLQQTAVETVRALANAIDAKDHYTSGHSERVGWLARLTGAALGLPEPQLQILEWAGILHDVGKIGVSDEILNNPGALTPAQFNEMKRHPRLSYEVLKPVARLGPALDAVLYHHENWDGSGYPEGLHGEQIPLFARIIRVADTFDALTSTRAYRAGFTWEEALAVLAKEAGRTTDPHVTRAFLAALERFRRDRPAQFRARFAHAITGATPATAVGAGAPAHSTAALPKLGPLTPSGGTP